MENVSLKPVTAVTGLVLLLGFAIGDIGLLVHSLHQSSILQSIAARQSAGIPALGTSLPIIAGTSLKSGKPVELLPAASPPIALLVFRESCHFCEANWKNWDRLFGQGGLDTPVFFVTADKAISQTYREKHPMLNSRAVLLGVDPTILSTLKLGLTPQTIYVVGGRIKQDWAGVLSNDNIEEIKKTLSRD